MNWLKNKIRIWLELDEMEHNIKRYFLDLGNFLENEMHDKFDKINQRQLSATKKCTKASPVKTKAVKK